MRALCSIGPFARRQLRSSIDAEGCPACGGIEFVSRRIIDDDLAATWGLTTSERSWFDEREGHRCAGCGMSKRVRMIAWAIRRLDLDLVDLHVLHVNQINHLSPVLAGSRSLQQTRYDAQDPPGAVADGLVNQDIADLTFPECTFDLVLHSETLEHVFDFERALGEVARVLRPGGFQIYTVPLLHHRRTIRRARRRDDGTIEFLHPPSYHGLEAEDLVAWEFGGDFIRRRAASIHRIFYDDFFANPTVFVVVERKPLTGHAP